MRDQQLLGNKLLSSYFYHADYSFMIADGLKNREYIKFQRLISNARCCNKNYNLQKFIVVIAQIVGPV